MSLCVVEPKKQRLAQATSQLQEKQAVLADAKAKLKEVGQKCLKLQGYNFGGSRGTLSTIRICNQRLTAVLCVCWLASETNNLIINSELMREGKQQ